MKKDLKIKEQLEKELSDAVKARDKARDELAIQVKHLEDDRNELLNSRKAILTTKRFSQIIKRCAFYLIKKYYFKLRFFLTLNNKIIPFLNYYFR